MKSLIVEDNESMRALYRLFFQSIGFDADEAPDGRIAFQMIKKNDYDLIISDMDMPVLNGMELYRLIDSYSPRLISRFMFSTGNVFNEEYQEFFKTVPCPVLAKPFLLSELRAAIDRMLSFCHEENTGKAPEAEAA